MDDGLEDFADFNDFGATPAEGGAGAAATPAAGTPATTPSTATPAAGAPATGTPAPKTSKSNRQKKAPSTNKIVGFAPEANVTYGDDIDDEGEGWISRHVAWKRPAVGSVHTFLHLPHQHCVHTCIEQASVPRRLSATARMSRRARVSLLTAFQMLSPCQSWDQSWAQMVRLPPYHLDINITMAS
jgi:hypothetical protein